MEKIHSIAHLVGSWIQSNPGWFAVISTYLLVAVINSAAKYPKAAGVVRFLRQVVDMLAPWTHADSPGTWKPPLITLRKGEDGKLGFALSLSLPPPGRDPIKAAGASAQAGFVRPGVLLAISLVWLAYVFCFGGCTPAQTAAWKTTGIDQAMCLAPSVVNAAGDAAIELMNSAIAGQPVNAAALKALGQQLAQKYGAPAFLCAIGKLWGDIGAAALARHGQMTPLALQLQYLIEHQKEIVDAAKPVASATGGEWIVLGERGEAVPVAPPPYLLGSAEPLPCRLVGDLLTCDTINVTGR